MILNPSLTNYNDFDYLEEEFFHRFILITTSEEISLSFSVVDVEREVEDDEEEDDDDDEDEDE